MIIIYVSMFWLCFNVIFPIEYYFLGESSAIASLIFLPHAVRVLSSWLLGPKALFALIPAEIITHTIWGLEYTFYQSYLIPSFSSSSAVLACESLRIMGYRIYPSQYHKPNWIGVIVAGVLASIFNSLSGAYLKSEAFAKEDFIEIIARYIIGDTTGLILSMIMLMYFFRFVDMRTTTLSKRAMN
ncbi:MAG: hypothetical protein ACO3TT_03815 [Candidatus Puniceispirillales bacterium]